MIEAARDVLRPASVRQPIPPAAEPGTIVVTAPTDDPEPDMYEDDPRTLDRGNPRSPDVSGLPPCAPVCIGVGSDPVDPLIIDLKAIPEAPPGSDAAAYAEEQ